MITFKKNGIEIKVDTFEEFLEITGKQVEPGKGNTLEKHFGKLKRGYDGLQSQREQRYGSD